MPLVGAFRSWTIALAAALLCAAPVRATAADLVVFAAASLKNALDDIAVQWQRETGKAVRISYAASSALAKQIEAGAPTQLFISADLEWMDYLAQRNLVKPDTRSNLLGNRIVLIAPKDSNVALSIAPGFALVQALGGGRLAMANTGAVPAGKYGKAALQKLGVWDAVECRTAQAENVRAALVLVSRAEAPLGIVYRTDAAADPNVRIVDAFPEDTHPPIVYPAALTAAASHPDAAPFLAYLRSQAARPLFEKQGFTVLSPPPRRGTS